MRTAEERRKRAIEAQRLRRTGQCRRDAVVHFVGDTWSPWEIRWHHRFHVAAQKILNRQKGRTK